jgi:hypothetical protein
VPRHHLVVAAERGNYVVDGGEIGLVRISHAPNFATGLHENQASNYMKNRYSILLRFGKI